MDQSFEFLNSWGQDEEEILLGPTGFPSSLQDSHLDGSDFLQSSTQTENQQELAFLPGSQAPKEESNELQWNRPNSNGENYSIICSVCSCPAEEERAIDSTNRFHQTSFFQIL